MAGLTKRGGIWGASLLALAPAAPASAADWLYTPSVSVEVAATDNAAADAKGAEKADVFATVRPALSVRGDGARVKMGLDYSIGASRHLRETELDKLQHSLLQTGSAELLRELLFVDTRASVAQSSIAATGGQTASSTSRTGSNTTTISTASITPRVVNHFGDWVNSQLSYKFNQTVSSALANTRTHDVTERLTSGEAFSRLRWTAEAGWTKTTSSTSEASQTALTGNPAGDTDKKFARFSPEYTIDRTFTLLSSAGYEKIDDDTLAKKPDGPTGLLGLRFTPGDRLTTTVNYNLRYDDTFWTGDAAYLLGADSTIKAAYTQSIQNSQSLIRENLDFLTVGPGGVLIDLRTGQPFLGDSSGLSLTNVSFRQERFTLSFSTVLERDVLYFEAFQEKRTSTNLASNATTMGAFGTWQRELQPLLKMNVSLRATNTVFEDLASREDNLFVGSVGFNYSLSETATASLLFNSINRISSADNGGLQQNIVTIGLRKTF